MKKTNLFLVLFLIVTLLSTVVFATDTAVIVDGENDDTSIDQIYEDEQENVPQVIESDKVFTGEDIKIDKPIAGNVVAIGKNVTLVEKMGIGGSLYVIAENFTMEYGTGIYGNLYVLAQNITINGAAYQIYATGDNVNIEYNGGSQTDLKIMAKELKVNGVVGRNIYADVDKMIIDTEGEIQGDLIYTSKSEAVYIEKTMGDNDEVLSENEVTEIPTKNVAGEKKFTKRDKKIYSNDNEIKNAVAKIIKDTKNMDEEKMQKTIVSNLLGGLGVKSNSEIAKGASKSVRVPVVFVYIDIIVIIALVVALVLPKINKKDPNEKSEKTENK